MQTPANIDKWIQAASADLNMSMPDQLKASNLFHEFQRLDWWSDYSDDGDVRYREMIRTGNALDQLKEFAGAGEEHAYLASRIYDKTAPEEFSKPRPWYVPAGPETAPQRYQAEYNAAVDRFIVADTQNAETVAAGMAEKQADDWAHRLNTRDREARAGETHSRWTGEPLGETADLSQSDGIGQSS